MTTDTIYQIGWLVMLSAIYARDWISIREGKR